MTKQEYQRAFQIYLSSLMGAAQRYLASKGESEAFNPLAEGVELSLGTVHLSDDEFQKVNQRILEILTPLAVNEPARTGRGDFSHTSYSPITTKRPGFRSFYLQPFKKRENRGVHTAHTLHPSII